MFYLGALVAFGLGALLAVSEFAYTLLKWCGAAYLCWLGIQLLMRPRQQFSMHPEGAKPTNNWFLRGMLGNVLNPKWASFMFHSYRNSFRWTFASCLDISSGRDPRSHWYAVVTDTYYCDTLCRSGFEKPAVVKWMDRSTGCLFLLLLQSWR